MSSDTSSDERLSLTERVRRAAAPSLSDAVKNASHTPSSSLPCLATPAEGKAPAHASAPRTVIGRRTLPLRVRVMSPARKATPANDRPHVFVVHGHDDAARLEVTRFLERAGFVAVVLQEQAHKGQTILEKIEAAGPIVFAVIIMTPDDECLSPVKSRTEAVATRRARQNVIWEHAYFTARLGRSRTSILKKDDVEIPSDMSGLGLIELDPRGAWKLELARELKDAGLPFDNAAYG